MRPRGTQQIRRFLDGRTELARQIVGAALAHREAHEKAESGRFADQPDRHGLLQDLFQLVAAVEGEIGDIVIVKRRMDRMTRLDRVHKMQLRLGQYLAHQRDLGQRGAVEMADAAGPDGAQDARLGVAFDGVQNLARERRDEAAGLAGDHRRAQAKERLRRSLMGDHGIDGGKKAAGRGAQREAGLGHCTILLGQGGDTRVNRPSDQIRVNAAAERMRSAASNDRAGTSHRVPEHIRIP